MQNLTSITQSSSGNLTIKSGKSLSISGTFTPTGTVDLTGATVTGMTATASAVAPDADDGAALGTTSLKWSDLFLAEGGVINWDSGDCTLTQAGNVLTLAGADFVADVVTVNTGLSPDANDGAYLGQAGTAFSDLFLAEGGVINWDSGDATLTQASDVVTLAGASLTLAVGATVNDDMVLTLGTTTATAETKITLEFDETTTGIGLFNMGSTSAPMVLATNPGSGVIAHTVNILHSAGAGDCDDLLGSYTKVAFSGDGDSGCTAVGGAFRAYVGTAVGDATVVKELYGIQPWCSHDGTGAITAMSALSAKCDVNTGAFTASTVNAGHFHIEGAGAVTGQFDGVMIEVYPDVTCLDSMLALVVDSEATVTSGIRVSGAMTNLLKLDVTTAVVANALVPAAAPDAGTMGADKAIVVDIGGTPYYIPLYDTLHA